MKKTLFLVMALFVLSLLGNTTQAYGMEMSAEQEELWSRVEKRWELMKNKDVEALKTSVGKNSVYWISWKHLPGGRITYANAFRGSDIASYELKPFEVRITGNVGIVMYTWAVKDSSGTVWPGRTTDTYIEQDGKWSLFGGMSASCKNPSPCPCD